MKLDIHNELKYRADFILNYYFIGENASFDDRIQEWMCTGMPDGARDEALHEIWDTRVKCAEPDEYALRSLDVIRERLGFVKPGRVKKAGSWPRIAAAALFFVFITYGTLMLVVNDRSADDPQYAATAAAEISCVTVGVEGIARRHVVLPDGSQVWVGNYSRITFPSCFETERRVWLTGTAYFSVVARDSTPFRVEGNNISVNVLGTEFEMRSPEGGETAEVTLAKGMVEVTLADCEPVLMKPNEKLSYDGRDGAVSVVEVEGCRIAPWKDMTLAFDDTPLAEALQKISAYYGVTMEVDGGIPSNCKITGRFTDNEVLDEVLFVVGKTTGIFRYEIEGETVRLMRR